MPAECAFILPTGKRCRCIATARHRFCRHHGAPAGSHLAASFGFSRRALWRELGRSAATLPFENIPAEIFSILSALLEPRLSGISDRFAGRVLRTLLLRCGCVPFEVNPAPAAGAIASSAADLQAGILGLEALLRQHGYDLGSTPETQPKTLPEPQPSPSSPNQEPPQRP